MSQLKQAFASAFGYGLGNHVLAAIIPSRQTGEKRSVVIIFRRWVAWGVLRRCSLTAGLLAAQSIIRYPLLRHEWGIPRIPRDFWVESTALCSLISSKYCSSALLSMLFPCQKVTKVSR
jgi:hypothetical protein